MNFASPYITYVLAAYGISAVLLCAMAWRSWRRWQQADRLWQDIRTTVSDDESEVL